MFDMNQIGKNISNLRKSIGITQMDLADKLGISFQAISNWERGIWGRNWFRQLFSSIRSE